MPQPGFIGVASGSTVCASVPHSPALQSEEEMAVQEPVACLEDLDLFMLACFSELASWLVLASGADEVDGLAGSAAAACC